MAEITGEQLAKLIANLQGESKQVFCAALTGLLANPNVMQATHNSMGGMFLTPAAPIVEHAFKITAAWMQSTAEAHIETGSDALDKVLHPERYG